MLDMLQPSLNRGPGTQLWSDRINATHTRIRTGHGEGFETGAYAFTRELPRVPRIRPGAEQGQPNRSKATAAAPRMPASSPSSLSRTIVPDAGP